jgi:hypothetical protein
MSGDGRAVHLPDEDTEDTEEAKPTLPVRVAEFLDELPIAPHRLSKKILDRHLDRQDRVAQQRSLRWRQLNAQRETGFREMGDLFEMFEIEKRLTPDPFYLDTLRKLQHATAYRLVRTVKGYRDLIVRGWRDSDVWNLGDTNIERLGEQLLYLADIAHGWPGTEEFPTFEDWEEALRFHGTVMATLTEDRSIDREHALHAWSELHRGAGRESEATKAAWDEMHRVEDDEHQLIEDSLIWFAKHYRQLWD